VSYRIERVPTQLIDVWTLDSGERVTLRPVLPQDAELAQALVRALSPAARYQRFFAPIRELSPVWLARLTQIDYRRQVAVLAETFVAGTAVAVGEARYVLADGEDVSAEFAVVVGDGWQRRGIARRLLGALLRHAQAEGIGAMHGETLADNRAMIQLARGLGFRALRHADDARPVLLRRPLGDQPAVGPCRPVHAVPQPAAPAGY
jgi:acetyltransferase